VISFLPLLVIVSIWATWELRQRSVFERGLRRTIRDSLSPTGCWTGSWVVELRGENSDAVRSRVMEGASGSAKPVDLATALRESGKVRVVGHVVGPTGVSKTEALHWLDNVGPTLSRVAFRRRRAGPAATVFALAYASDDRPTSCETLLQIIEYLEDCFASSLVACVQADRAPAFVRYLRPLFALAAASALLLGADRLIGGFAPSVTAVGAPSSTSLTSHSTTATASQLQPSTTSPPMPPPFQVAPSSHSARPQTSAGSAPPATTAQAATGPEEGLKRPSQTKTAGKGAPVKSIESAHAKDRGSKKPRLPKPAESTATTKGKD
jgi:hypothetical protein